MDDVAKKCNVTKATVYYYFDSKAALFTEAMIQMMSHICTYMEALLMEHGPLRTRLHKGAKAHLQATVDIDLDSFLREIKNALTEEQHKQMQKVEYRMVKLLEQDFIEAMEAKEIPEIHTKFAAHSYVSLLKIGNYRSPDQTKLFLSVVSISPALISFTIFCQGYTF